MNNITKFSPKEQRYRLVTEGDHGLFRSLQLAGSSFGVVTEFHYGLFEGPEVLPVYAFVYIESKNDLANFERAGINGR